MRLVLIEAVVGWGAALKVYEDVVESECLDLPYSDVSEKVWEVTVVLSWRWGAQKPAARQAGFSPMQPSQSEALVGALRRMADAGFVYVWIDWCCVPQYSAPSMVEVLRSKVFYARARTMLVLPTFHPLPTEGIIRPLLARMQQQLLTTADEGASDAAAAAAALGAILSKGHMACREYLSRVWTLAERLARYGRDEPLSCWLGLEAWLGMLLDSVLASAGVAHACNGHRVDDPKATVALYIKALDAGGAAADEGSAAEGVAVQGVVADSSTRGVAGSAQLLVEALAPLLAAASATGSLLGDGVAGLDAPLSDLMHTGARVWRLARLGEAPSSTWLLGYLADMQTGVYQAWSDPDRVWALYSYFSWKKPEMTSPAALAEAVKDLVSVAGGGAEHLAVAGSKLGLGARRLAAIAGVLGLGEFEEAERAKVKALGHTAMVEALLAAGAGKDVANELDGRTPLSSAADAGHTEVVKALLAAGASQHITDKHGWTPLHMAAYSGHTEVVTALLAAGGGIDIATKDGAPALYWAAYKGRMEVVKALLAAGASTDIANKDKLTPLYVATHNGHTEVVKVLLAAGAGTDIADTDGKTPMHLAATNGNTEMVTALLASGAGTDIVDKDRWTALHMAASNGHSEILMALLVAGARRDILDRGGHAPLDVARNHDIKDLLQHYWRPA
ncbi:hypothetical protein HXX76_012940 [Chlamydomonas incerta]|uniref:Heterokaryon incompatibility domain-containing protein n=1 Tax=Chlamydomonas incerta TaxID=51695 RepID=A0A835VVG3_CHLIN|nr:hypothetical protein HXX76_012940 [Chlamydomonas incerta]|eukprot:KAG2426626.1 hypothetical protein HXX76_012940 [Chlamydomonas incerta]